LPSTLWAAKAISTRSSIPLCLKEYYEAEGAQFARRIQIPLGEYRPEWIDVQVSPRAAEPGVAESSVTVRRSWIIYGLAAIAVLLATDNVRLRLTKTVPPSLPEFWRGVAQPGEALPTRWMTAKCCGWIFPWPSAT
jgi:hypothetical protein